MRGTNSANFFSCTKKGAEFRKNRRSRACASPPLIIMDIHTPNDCIQAPASAVPYCPCECLLPADPTPTKNFPSKDLIAVLDTLWNVEGGEGCLVSIKGDTEQIPVMKYGAIKDRVHRILYTYCFGNIPPDFKLKRKCRYSLCVNPHHMALAKKCSNESRRKKARRSLI